MNDPRFEGKLGTLYRTSLFCICDNFDRFNHAFLTSKDTRLQEHLQFLRRFCSEFIIQDIIFRKDPRFRYLDEKYFTFLLNEFLAVLDISWFRIDEYDEIMDRLLIMGHAITKVIFFEKHSLQPQWGPLMCTFDTLQDFLDTVVRHIPNVKTIEIMGNYGCNDRTLQDILHFCKHLTELKLMVCDLTSKGLETVCTEQSSALTVLKRLFIRCPMQNELWRGIAVLMRMFPDLDIEFRDLPDILHGMHKDDYTRGSLEDAARYNVTRMSFVRSSQYPLDTSMAIVSKVCRNVNVLDTVSTLSDGQVEALARFKKLRSITLRNPFGDGRILDCTQLLQTARYQYLERLRLMNFSLSITDVIGHFDNLEELVLDDVRFLAPQNDTEGGQGLPKLTSLRMRLMQFSNAETAKSLDMLLRHTPALKTLVFLQCKMEREPDIDRVIQAFTARTLPLQNLLFCTDTALRLVEFLVGSYPTLQRLEVVDCTALELLCISQPFSLRGHVNPRLNATLVHSKRTAEILCGVI